MIQALYEDDDFLIIDKPAGLAVQPGEGVRVSVLDAVERDFGFRPYLVHRLDKETAGCLLVARSPRAASELSALMGGRGAVKTYRAVVAGRPDPAEGAFRGDVRVKGEAVSAETRYRTVATDGRLALVEAVLGTGRTHQIRQHFAQAGHPIVGDDRHGDFKLNKALAKELGAKRLFLYAASLYLPLRPPVEARASLPPHFAAFFERWGLGGDA
ncbi:MAG: RluA family pseudouridine synthase [Spirochaetes bacterium]|nr:RluA family pseudouridine synthase [Spirochaetota bacterium]MBU1081060.1 RluA family pseudouridine synthase [Spirochaetota bacterium]